MPSYDDLPPLDEGGRSAWGVFGEGPSHGTVSLQTPERIAAAASLVRTGELFSLNAPVTWPDPPLFLRKAVEHTLLAESATPGFDERLDVFYPQGSSQWDSLAHVGYAPDRFYNGASAADIHAGPATPSTAGPGVASPAAGCCWMSMQCSGAPGRFRPGQLASDHGRRPGRCSERCRSLVGSG